MAPVGGEMPTAERVLARSPVRFKKQLWDLYFTTQRLGKGDVANRWMYLVSFQPVEQQYSDGADDSHVESGGWVCSQQAQPGEVQQGFDQTNLPVSVDMGMGCG